MRDQSRRTSAVSEQQRNNLQLPVGARRAHALERELRLAKLMMGLRVARARLAAAEIRDKLETEVKLATHKVKVGVTKVKRGAGKTVDFVEDEIRLTASDLKLGLARARDKARKTADKIEDEARFIRTWLENPLKTGAVSPSSAQLATTMASYVDISSQAPVIELGPGTGPVTDALVRHGVPPSRLILIEYDPDFCRLLRDRYPSATVVQGDAYDIGRTLAGILNREAGAVVSGLPLLTRPPVIRKGLLEAAFELMEPGAPFIQFTYGAKSPVPLDGSLQARCSNRIWRNIPPARVWVYRRQADLSA